MLSVDGPLILNMALLRALKLVRSLEGEKSDDERRGNTLSAINLRAEQLDRFGA